jgi:AraC family transcriptional regulator
MRKNIFFGLLLVIAGIAVWFLSQVGFLKSVDIQEVSYGPVNLLYAISEVETWAKSKSVECRKSFGEYLDDPSVIEHARLRSNGGCVIDQPVTDLPEGFKTKELPAKNYIQAKFAGAPMIGPYKVYGKVDDYLRNQQKQRTAVVIEIYEMLSEKELLTTYLFEPSTK